MEHVRSATLDARCVAWRVCSAALQVALVIKHDTKERYALKSLNKKLLVARYQALTLSASTRVWELVAVAAPRMKRPSSIRLVAVSSGVAC